jgi:hypothetical protein
MSPRFRLARYRLGCLLLLVGCAGGEDRDAQLTAALENGRASLTVAGAVVPIRASPAVAAPVAAPLALTPIPVSHSPAGPQPGATQGLMGAAPETLRRWLGEPQLRRKEGPAEVWLYAGSACALDLVLYPSAGGLRVGHAEARASGAAPRTEQHCLQELAASGRPGGPVLPMADAAGRSARGGG